MSCFESYSYRENGNMLNEEPGASDEGARLAALNVVRLASAVGGVRGIASWRLAPQARFLKPRSQRLFKSGRRILVKPSKGAGGAGGA
ncbi:hypothetical protein V6N11_009451 [Hibiscus sabdariffa]|uniref:Uncharacterized protein n=1 Tax=Hibiscus sabdariffa TaxID=183260 RepID=A0ABR2P5G6_9ROSI